METITNLTSAATTAASKAIWGEQPATGTKENETAGQEPISGAQGKGTATEPFDQGNAETPTTTTNTTAVTGLTTTDTTKPTTTDSTDKTGVTLSPEDPGKPEDIKPSGSQPTTGVLPDPTTYPTIKDADKTKDPKDEAAELMAKRDPNDHSGEPMKVHDGPEKTALPTTQEERRDSNLGQPGGQEHGKEAKGTGEQYVKSTGLAADGGDFDATKPGAAREADRLMEERGLKGESPAAADKTTSPSETKNGSSSEGGTKEKVHHLSDKIKQKLHIGHKDK